jgi:hypothetical protein
MKKIITNKKFKNIVIFTIFLLFTTLVATSLKAQGYNFNEDSGLNTTSNIAGYETGSDAETVDSLIGTIIYVVLGLVGVVFFGLIIFSGVKWMIAQGNEQKISRAKESLFNAIIGLIITLAAYAISYFIIGYFL